MNPYCFPTRVKDITEKDGMFFVQFEDMTDRLRVGSKKPELKIGQKVNIVIELAELE